MNCPNCGARMDLAESRDHMRCRHCGTYGFAEPARADGIRVVGHAPDAPSCPVCSRRMEAALLDDNPMHFCARCRGVLLPRTTFAGTVNKRRAWAVGPPGDPLPLDRHALERTLACPACRGAFETFPHYGPGNVVIDNCPRCDLIWLDYGEMRRIVDAPGRDRGTGQVTRIDDEYVRAGDPRPAESLDADPVRSLFDLLFRG